MVHFAGDKWRPASERYGDRSLVREDISKCRNNDSFWRRDRLEGGRDRHTFNGREHADKGSAMQVEQMHPPTEPQDTTHPGGRPRSSSMTVPTERPRLHARQVSQGPLPSTTLPKSPHLTDSLASHSELTSNATLDNIQTKGTDPPADLQFNTKTLDPRLKNRINTAVPPQSGARSPTMLSDSTLSQPHLIEKLIDIKLREQKQVDDHRKILKYISELESERDQAAQQFGNPNPYSVQLSETITSTQLRANILQLQVNNLKKEEESCRRVLSANHDSCPSDTELQRLKEGMSQQERESAIRAEEIKELKRQIERLVQSISATHPQTCPQEHKIKTLEGMVADIKAAIEIDRSSTNGVSGQLVEVRRNVKHIQDTDLDGLRAEVREQKLALARLNDVFVGKDSLKDLQRRCDEIQAKSTSDLINAKKYVSYEDLNTYIQKFNTFELQTGDRLHKLETQDLVKSTELKNYARADNVAEVIRGLALEEKARNELTSRVVDLQTVSSENVAKVKDHGKRLNDMFNKLVVIAPHLDGINNRLHAVETTQSTLAKSAVAEKLSPDDKRQLQQISNIKQDMVSVQQRLQTLDNNIENDKRQLQQMPNLRQDMVSVQQRLQTLDNNVQLQHMPNLKQDMASIQQRLQTLYNNFQLQQVPNLKQDMASIQQRLQTLDNNFQNNNHSITSLSERFNKLKTDDLAYRIVGKIEPMLSTIKPQLLRLHAQDQETQTQLKQINGLYGSLSEGLTKAKLDTAEALTVVSRAADTMKDFELRASKIEDSLETMTSEYPSFQGAQDELKESQKTTAEGLRDTNRAVMQSHEELQQKLAKLQDSIKTMEHELSGLRDEARADSTSMKDDIQVDQEKLLNQFIEARDTFNARLEKMEIELRQRPDSRSSVGVHSHAQSPVSQVSPRSLPKAVEGVENAAVPSTTQIEPGTRSIRVTKDTRVRTHSAAVGGSPVDRSFDSSGSDTPVIPKIEDCFIPNRDDDSGGAIDATPRFRPKSGKNRAVSRFIAIPDSDDEIDTIEPSRSEVENSAQSSEPDVPVVNMDEWVGKVPRKGFKSTKRVDRDKAMSLNGNAASVKTPDKMLKLKRKRESPAMVIRNARSTDSSQSTSQGRGQSEKKKKVKT